MSKIRLTSHVRPSGHFKTNANMPLMIKMALYEIQFDTPGLGDLNLNRNKRERCCGKKICSGGLCQINSHCNRV